MDEVEDDYLKIENSQVDLLTKSESFDDGGVTFLEGGLEACTLENFEKLK